jgi:hypothetical protein
MFPVRPCAVRWTIGDVSPSGFEALQLSIWGAWRVFGASSEYVVCVNSLPLAQAQALTGEVPDLVVWRSVTDEIPGFLRPYFDSSLADGAGWKLAPLQVFAERHELSLDNDCILWEMPQALRAWLDGSNACLIAADVHPCFGQFDGLCGPEPRNAGIRGLPPGFDLEAAIRHVLAEHPCRLLCEGDEQGLQVAVVTRSRSLHVVPLDDVTLCAPFPPYSTRLGRCGAHFVGLNAKHIPTIIEGRPASEHIQENWRRQRERICEKVMA